MSEQQTTTPTPTPAPERVPDEYILKTNRLFVSVEQFDGEIGLTVVRE